jgi:hypothetical protein
LEGRFEVLINKSITMKLITFLILTSTFCTISCSKDCQTTGVKENCYCTLLMDPVCGCDKVTYSNPCLAECSGITEYTKGECN